jgi:hypothetical protein
MDSHKEMMDNCPIVPKETVRRQNMLNSFVQIPEAANAISDLPRYYVAEKSGVSQ